MHASAAGMLSSPAAGVACPLRPDDECGGWSLGCALHYGGPNDCGMLQSSGSLQDGGQYQLRLTGDGNLEMAFQRSRWYWPNDVLTSIVWSTAVAYPVPGSSVSSGSASDVATMLSLNSNGTWSLRLSSGAEAASSQSYGVTYAAEAGAANAPFTLLAGNDGVARVLNRYGRTAWASSASTCSAPPTPGAGNASVSSFNCSADPTGLLSAAGRCALSLDLAGSEGFPAGCGELWSPNHQFLLTLESVNVYYGGSYGGQRSDLVLYRTDPARSFSLELWRGVGGEPAHGVRAVRLAVDGRLQAVASDGSVRLSGDAYGAPYGTVNGSALGVSNGPFRLSVLDSGTAVVLSGRNHIAWTTGRTSAAGRCV
jgi:hypothetical protein